MSIGDLVIRRGVYEGDPWANIIGIVLCVEGYGHSLLYGVYWLNRDAHLPYYLYEDELELLNEGR